MAARSRVRASRRWARLGRALSLVVSLSLLAVGALALLIQPASPLLAALAERGGAIVPTREPEAPAPARAPDGRVEGPLGVVFGPTAGATRRRADDAGSPVLVMLHGMGMDPGPTCDFWPAPVRGDAFLVCPRGNGTLAGASDWVGPTSTRVAHAQAAIDDATTRFGDFVSPRGVTVLAGFSRGAFLARDLVYAGHGARSVVLLGAALSPDPARFAAAGVRRVILAATRYDGAYATMKAATARLVAGGVAARFVDLGLMGHGLPADLAERLAEPMEWVSADESS